MPNGQFANLVAAGTAISCVDRPYPRQVTAYEQLAARLGKVAPDFGAADAWSNFTCAYWPVPPQGGIGDPRPGQPAHSRDRLHGRPGDSLPVGASRGPSAGPRPASHPSRAGPHRLHQQHFVQRWTDRYLKTLELPPKNTSSATTG